MSMADEDRPFLAEYAKSGRASCKLCRGAIAKDTLRLAKMVQVSVAVEIPIIAHPSYIVANLSRLKRGAKSSKKVGFSVKKRDKLEILANLGSKMQICDILEA